ncbi:inositol monophosphatase family protein [Rhodopirellula sp. P2]|uniref:inositol monophosphatase family protein n=1 Tax=Rhodopirellula sp. P2 TaxID=2127060 RepID=UPI0023687963|nr:inositol monophosphatase family protein [Rhodopirellula sp. P2]WDQ19319.1 inositol monophosphatase family protein [Rhodopirellula sp. P2]
MSENDLRRADLLETAVQAAKVGGEILRRYFENGVMIRDKSVDGGKTYDLVSDADLESEQAVATLIREAYPDHELLGEEDLQGGDSSAEHLWVIDPLDGTNNFAHHLPHFAVSIAYYESGVPIVGAVYNPIRNDLFTTVQGQGAFQNGTRVQVSESGSLNQSMIGCGFYYDRGEMMRATLDAIAECFQNEIHGIRRFGAASLDLCEVGCGGFDAFFEYKLSPWDFAAGALFITEAGGQITTATGDALPLETTSVLASNGKVHAAMLEITKRHALPDNQQQM